MSTEMMNFITKLGTHDMNDDICNRCGLPIHPNTPCEEIIQYYNHVDNEYFNLVNCILNEGKRKKNRTGVDTLSVFGHQFKIDVKLDAFPILTTKRVYFKAIVHELLWFLSGSTNVKYLVDNDVKIWDQWIFAKYQELNENKRDLYDPFLLTQEENIAYKSNVNGHRSIDQKQDAFIRKLKEDSEFAIKWGDLGQGTYGSMWRDYPSDVHKKNGVHVLGVDQLETLINKLRHNPDDRRMIVNAWHPYWATQCALPPCHCFLLFNTEELTIEEQQDLDCKSEKPTRKLNLLMLIRSQDTFLGCPFNISSYSLLIAMIAHCVGMAPGTLTYTIGDAHLYVNHIDQVKLQLTRLPKKLPLLWLNPTVWDLFSFKYEDIKLIGYDSHSTIKADVAV